MDVPKIVPCLRNNCGQAVTSISIFKIHSIYHNLLNVNQYVIADFGTGKQNTLLLQKVHFSCFQQCQNQVL